MFIMVTASFFFVCGVSATRFDGYYQYGTVTSIVTDSVSYNDLSIPAGTESYFDVSFTFGQVSYYNSTMQQISVGSVTYSTSVGFLSISCSEPSVVISYDENNRVHCFFQNDFSGNLQFSIKYYIRNTLTGGSPANTNLQSITMRRAVTTHYSSMNHSFIGAPSLGGINDKLDQIINSLGFSSTPDYLGSEAYFYFSSDYFSRAWTTVDQTFSDDGYLRLAVGSAVGIQFYNELEGSYLQNVSLPPGTYILSLAVPGSVENISSVLGNSYVDSSLSHLNGYTYFTGIVTTSSIVNVHSFSIYWEGTSGTGIIYGGVSRAPDDYLAGSAVNPDQSGLVDDVDNAGQQQAQQEEQLWSNINSYKGDLTFNLDDWSEAAGGLSYVSGIFMQIWNNSPTQVIILSLMLGIAMLSIGRGVQAAVRVSRHRDDG